MKDAIGEVKGEMHCKQLYVVEYFNASRKFLKNWLPDLFGFLRRILSCFFDRCDCCTLGCRLCDLSAA